MTVELSSSSTGSHKILYSECPILQEAIIKPTNDANKLFYNIKTDLTVNIVCHLKHFTNIIKYKGNNLLPEQCTVSFITLTHS
jgi:hypothetical protein